MAAIGPVSAALIAWREDQRAHIAQVLRNSVICIPLGQRIRNLRTLLGWSQIKAAAHFGVSVRTVIRHERGESRCPWTPLLLKVRALEDAHAEELIAFLVHAERSEVSASGSPSGDLISGSADAFSGRHNRTSLPRYALGRTVWNTKRFVDPGPLLLGAGPLKSPAPTTDRDQTVSRRSWTQLLYRFIRRTA